MKKIMKPGFFGAKLSAYVFVFVLVSLAVSCRKNDIKNQLKDLTDGIFEKIMQMIDFLTKRPSMKVLLVRLS